MESFDYKKTAQYWLDGAEYDYVTARSLMAAGRFPHALFFGHLVLEKLLKAVYVKEHQKHAPFTHSLVLLAENSGVQVPEEMLAELAEFTQFNIEARYPEEKESFYNKATKGFRRKKIQRARRDDQMVPQDIRDIIRRYIEAVRAAGIQVDGAYLFGSYAADKATPWSDIDIALLLPGFKGDKFDQTMELRKIGLKIDSRIEPIAFITSSFMTDDWLPIVYEIKAHGIPVEAAA